MAIFNSYVSLPEGMVYIPLNPIDLRGVFTEKKKASGDPNFQRGVLSPSMRLRLEPRGFNMRMGQRSEKQTGAETD